MTVLTRDIILKLIKDGEIKIKPFKEEQVGPASIDLHLGNSFRVFKRAHEPVKVSGEPKYKEITESVEIGGKASLLIMPGELVNGITQEEVWLPDNICGRILGRSGFARMGLLTHLSSGFIHPGSKNRIALEIINLSPVPLAITPGIKICQIVLEWVEGKAKYKGRFQFQKKP
ncbi:MAG: dCTP deaminase [Candidatus Aenigmarchaeota archaeon]|nr:dCTP deaminase [Candidatus Aenigmarchaeota archaeon]